MTERPNDQEANCAMRNVAHDKAGKVRVAAAESEAFTRFKGPAPIDFTPFLTHL
jgi:hypothetical protein